jgi:hypothetical protein
MDYRIKPGGDEISIMPMYRAGIMELHMSDFDFEKRRKEKLQTNQQEADGLENETTTLASEAQELSASINRYYGPKFHGQFDHSISGSTITVTKKGGGSTLKIEVLGKEKFKLSGGSGPGGLNADVGQSMSDVSKEDMMDTLDEWFSIATS